MPEGPLAALGAADRALTEDVVAAVRAAVAVCRSVRQRMASDAALAVAKRDESPVTAADYAVQALLCRALSRVAPRDPVMAEETADELRAVPSLESAVQRELERAGAGATAAELRAWLDRGSLRESADRFWAIDPIDGTKGFVGGRQYAIALARIDGGVPTFGVLACPEIRSGEGRGVVQVGWPGRLAIEADLGEGGGPLRWRSLAVSKRVEVTQARCVQSFDPAHGAGEAVHQMVRMAGSAVAPIGVDSQAKYGLVNRGDAELFARFPPRASYREKVWDHAAGAAICAAAGGVVTDLAGRAFDWGRGVRLEGNRGLLVCTPELQPGFLAAAMTLRG